MVNLQFLINTKSLSFKDFTERMGLKMAHYLYCDMDHISTISGKKHVTD